MRFETPRSMALAEEFAFPRRAGTDGERRAADLVAGEFEKAGLRVERRAIECSSADPDTFLVLVSLCGLWAHHAFRGWPFPARVVLAAAAVGLPLAALMGQVLAGRATRLRSSNVLGEPPADAEAPVRVVLLTRLDAPPPRRALVMRVRCNEVILALAAAVFALGLAGADEWMARIGPTVFLGLWGAAALLVAQPWGWRRPPGVDDNRTGLAFLAELARVRPDRAREGIEFRFAATGAGAGGPRSLARQIVREWPKKPTLVIELAVPGLGREVAVIGWYFAEELALQAARDLWVPHRNQIWPVGELSIGSFSGKNIPGLGLIGDRRADRIDPALLAATAQLTIEIALRWAKRNP